MEKQLLNKILGRKQSLFHNDLQRDKKQLADSIDGRRILVVGAAGSIGSAFVKQLMLYKPKSVHLVDPAENNLVELVRDLRSSSLEIPDDFMTISISMGSLMFSHFLESQKHYDYVVNFSALKHVRVERDPFSLMQMLETNLFSLERLLRVLVKEGRSRIFSVSSDKAVNPANLMGASKALMEQLLYSFSFRVPYTTSRFANVAFSDGSLLHGFGYRFTKGQPFSAPNDVKRYFISHEESGQLCLMACFLGENRDIFIPRLNAETDLITFSKIAELYLKDRGFTPIQCGSDKEAIAMAEAGKMYSSKEWPCYFSGSDTSGEKAQEEFVGVGEVAQSGRFEGVDIIATQPPEDDAALSQTITMLEDIRDSDYWSTAEISEAIKISVPDLKHKVKSRNLDQKM
ncbi:MAG: polysaccharide biosynthesis protein [Magnetococcales bacterium]|nr:polysaccharide biosynthesis protein [Magnetococcales bacterium]